MSDARTPPHVADPFAPNGAPTDDLADVVTQTRLATLGSLIAGVTHELNTPLGAINSNHDVLRRALERLQAILADDVVEPHELDEVRRIVRALDGILHVNDLAVERMTDLVRNLRNFGRIDRAAHDYADLNEGLESTLALLAHEMRNVDVTREYGTIPPVYCHPQRIHQVFMNLLLNAIHAVDGAGSITVRTQQRGGEVAIVVQDDGAGMTDDQRSHIFEPGFTTRQGRVGMGLGLTICRQIVEQHGGRIAVESAPGAGSTFTVFLPLRQAT